MAKSTKTGRLKTAATPHAVPQNRDEAMQAITAIGGHRRVVKRLEADMNDEITAIKQRYEKLAEPHNTDAANLVEGLRIWAEANRIQLTGGDKTKTVDLGTGVIRWRMLPPSVTHRGHKVDAVLDMIRARPELTDLFLRTKEELNKEAVLAAYSEAQKDPESFAKLRAQLVAIGLTVGSQGEDFVVEPTQLELSEQESA